MYDIPAVLCSNLKVQQLLKHMTMSESGPNLALSRFFDIRKLKIPQSSSQLDVDADDCRDASAGQQTPNNSKHAGHVCAVTIQGLSRHFRVYVHPPRYHGRAVPPADSFLPPEMICSKAVTLL
jgi:hypothetical protein